MIDKERLEIYNQYRNHLLTDRRSSFEHFDKAILTLSSGGLALSLTFVKDIVPVSHLTSLNILFISWGSFAVSILLTLISFISSQYAIDLQIRYAQNYYVDGKEEFFDKRNMLTTATKILNICSAICFVFAVILTIYFASINLSKEVAILNNQDQVKEVVREDYFYSQVQASFSGNEVIKGITPSEMPKVPSSQTSTGSGQDGGSNPPPTNSGGK